MKRKEQESEPLTDFQKNVIEWDKRDSWLDAIVLAYTLNIKHDYPIPHPHNISNAVDNALEKLKVPKTFKNRVLELTREPRDEMSRLENYVRYHETRFGSEWFYGYGLLFRWREGERLKAEDRIANYIPTRDRNLLKKLQEMITIKKPVEPFQMDKAMGVVIW